MPPPDSGKHLTEDQKTLLARWIAEGGKYESHWAFVKLETSIAPPGRGADSPIDAFVAAKLKSLGMEPSHMAPPETLIRRASLDLTGIGPTPEETAEFLKAWETDRDAAWKSLLNRLLASSRFGEHFAAAWLDLARYADTSGFQGDPNRSMWRWRDYVIDSFNQNKPFDQFTREQIAGDLLPHPTAETRLATGFHRNHRYNTEFGAVEAEWNVENVVDRVETVGATWLGLTLGCARCHDHKYDPITQREFYQFFAFFNNIPERGVYWDVFGDFALAFEPSIPAPLPKDAERLNALNLEVHRAEEQLARLAAGIDPEQQLWESNQANILIETPVIPLPENLVVHFAFDHSLAAEFGSRTLTNASAAAPQGASRMETLDFSNAIQISSQESPIYRPGILGSTLELRGSNSPLVLSNILDRPQVTLAFWLNPNVPTGVILSKMGQQPLFQHGIALSLTNAQVHFELNHDFFDFDATMVPVELTTKAPLAMHEWTHIAVVLDGNRTKRGPRIFINGVLAAVHERFLSARSLPGFKNSIPLRFGSPTARSMEGAVDDFRIYDRPLSDTEVELLAELPRAQALSVPRSQRSPEQRKEAQRVYARHISPTTRSLQTELNRLKETRNAFEQSQPHVMVMVENSTAPTAHVLFRGQYDAPRESVSAGIPKSLGQLDSDFPANRLGLADWMTSKDNPLVARVFVNRVWERLFGVGLVKTSENLGVQSEPPSHPELLDWLSAEFMRSGWDVKALYRTILNSSTYRQSAAFSGESRQRDPENRWLSRGPRFRLSAEAVRDTALHASGLLVEKVGGPSVLSYLPGEKRTFSTDLYRRSVYSVWQRTRFNPLLGTFDAPSREACTVRRPRTNTPLQALALLNETTFVEASRKLAERMLMHASEDAERVRFGFQCALARKPTSDELITLMALLTQQRNRLRASPELAVQSLKVGASPVNDSLDPKELAAFAFVTSALFNTDEFVTKE